MTVPPDNDHGIGPLLSDVTNDLLQQGGNIALLISSARFKNGGDQLARQPFVDMQGHVAIIMIIIVEQTKFLLTIGVVIGIITIYDDHFRFIGVGLNKGVKHLFAYTIQAFMANGVF